MRREEVMSYRILNEDGGIMRVGYADPKDKTKFIEENQWETLEDAEVALLLLTEYAIGGEMEAVKGLRIVESPDG